MTSTADYKAKTPGYTPANRYFARQHGVVGKTTTKDWNIQKKAVTGYTAASDQYFATKQRLAYHPADKTFNGYGLKANGSAQQAPPPPPPPPKVETKPAPAPAKSKGTMPKGFNAESAPKPKPAPAQTKPAGHSKEVLVLQGYLVWFPKLHNIHTVVTAPYAHIHTIF